MQILTGGLMKQCFKCNQKSEQIKLKDKQIRALEQSLKDKQNRIDFLIDEASRTKSVQQRIADVNQDDLIKSEVQYQKNQEAP